MINRRDILTWAGAGLIGCCIPYQATAKTRPDSFDQLFKNIKLSDTIDWDISKTWDGCLREKFEDLYKLIFEITIGMPWQVYQKLYKDINPNKLMKDSVSHMKYNQIIVFPYLAVCWSHGKTLRFENYECGKFGNWTMWTDKNIGQYEFSPIILADSKFENGVKINIVGI